MTDPCPQCIRPSPVYRMTCLPCCTRLVLSAHPHKALAASLLDAIQRHPSSPGRAAVLASVRLSLEKRP